MPFAGVRVKAWIIELEPPYVAVTLSIHTDDPRQIADVERAAAANGLKLLPIETKEAHA